MRHVTFFRVVVSLVSVGVLAFCFSGCGGSGATELPNAGKTIMFTAGVLGFDIECIPTISHDTSAIDLYWGIPPTALTFTKSPSGFESIYEIDVRISDMSRNVVLRDIAWAETTKVATYLQTQSFDPIEKSKRFLTPPGNLLFQVQIEDVRLKTRSLRFARVTLPEVRSTTAALGKMYIQWKAPGRSIIPFVFFHIPSGCDSLRASIPLWHSPPERPSELRFVMERFAADTGTPILPYLISSITPIHQWHSLEDDSNLDTVETLQSNCPPSSHEYVASFPIPVVPPGLYRLSVRAVVPKAPPGTGDTTLLERRIISIKGPTFPRPSTLSELIGALAYIATPDEMELMLDAKTPAEQRTQFDLFWLHRNIDRPAAANLIREYSARIEEANRYFSTFNEGWKTDRGMLYIVLGPPSEITNSIGSQSWVYDYSSASQGNVFIFTVSKLGGYGISLNEYSLQRSAIYETVWNRLVDHWWTGQTY